MDHSTFVEETMRRMALVLALLALVLPIAARADGINLTNLTGTVTITTAGIVSQGLQLRSFQTPGPYCVTVCTPLPNGALGSVSFSTGAFLGTDILSGGTFSSAGSSFVVTSSFKSLGHTGVIFSGSFVGPISWTLVAHDTIHHTQFYEFQLSGQIKGQLYTGQFVTGTTTQDIYVYKNQWSVDNKGLVNLGTTHLVVPEPGTLGMLGTGLVGMAGAFRRKLFGS